MGLGAVVALVRPRPADRREWPALIIVGVTNPTQPELVVLCQPDQANLVLEVSLGQPCEFFWEGVLDCDSAPEEK